MIPADASPLVYCTREALGAGVPDWVHLLTPGKLKTVDGRGPFAWEPGQVKLMGVSGEERIYIDINHATQKRGHRGEESPAVGWVMELQTRDDGLWGKVQWTPKGRQEVEAGSYRYLSAEIMVSDGRIVGLRGASLTNDPNVIGLKPLTQTTETGMDELLKLLTAELGLAATATAAEALETVKGLKTLNAELMSRAQAVAVAAKLDKAAAPDLVLQTVTKLADPALSVPADQVKALQAQVVTLSTNLATLKTDGLKEKAAAAFDAALKAGKPVVALKEHYLSRYLTDPVAVQKEFDALPSLTQQTLAQLKPAAAGGVEMLSAEDIKVAKTLGVDPAAFAKNKAADAAQRESI